MLALYMLRYMADHGHGPKMDANHINEPQWVNMEPVDIPILISDGPVDKCWLGSCANDQSYIHTC